MLLFSLTHTLLILTSPFIDNAIVLPESYPLEQGAALLLQGGLCLTPIMAIPNFPVLIVYLSRSYRNVPITHGVQGGKG